MWTLLSVLAVVTIVSVADGKKTFPANPALPLRVFYVVLIGLSVLLLTAHCLDIELPSLLNY